MKTLIGYTEACALLKLSKPTLKRYVFLRYISSYKIGRRRLFDPEELQEWVEKRKATELPPVFKSKWIFQIQKYMDQLQDIFADPEKLKTLSVKEQLRLYEETSKHVSRIMKFLFKLRAATLKANASSNTAGKQKQRMVNAMFS